MGRRVIVVGAGIIGASLAYRLAKVGASVTLLEAETLAAGTSKSSNAWLNSNRKPPVEYHRLNTAGMAEHHILKHEFGAAPWLHLHGNLEWVTDDQGREELRAKLDRLRAWGYPYQVIAPAEARALEPEVAFPPDADEVVFYPSEGHVEVPLLVGALARAAQAAGATIRQHTRVERIVVDGGRAQGVETEDGTVLHADAVVACLGPWTEDLEKIAGVGIPMASTVGLLAVTAPSPVGLKTFLHAPGIDLRPDGGGRIMMSHDEFDEQVDITTPVSPPPAVGEAMLDRAVAVLPGLEGVRVEAARIARRPIPADGYSVIGPVEGSEGLYLAATHSGVTLGPLIGRLLAHEIMTGEVDARLERFRPARLMAPA